MPFLELQPFGVTDAGKVRQNNEDALLVGEGKDETLFAVADGIGGFEAGEVASSIAIDVLKDLPPEGQFDQAIREANRRILAAGRGDEKLSGMGTTVVAIRFGGTRSNPVAEVAHVGDSRAYLVRGGEMKPVTEDHSLVAELVRSGDLTRAQAAEHPQKNLITRA
ncbi:MAG: protein phosphatase 2C domain-containing protein, partial [Actinomycetota bacterium]|nr:protein phosphatase 2C domain-containing protein [Actinomycetota bacterium]